MTWCSSSLRHPGEGDVLHTGHGGEAVFVADIDDLVRIAKIKPESVGSEVSWLLTPAV
jgi:hypothetical protein